MLAANCPNHQREKTLLSRRRLSSAAKRVRDDVVVRPVARRCRRKKTGLTVIQPAGSAARKRHVEQTWTVAGQRVTDQLAQLIGVFDPLCFDAQ